MRCTASRFNSVDRAPPISLAPAPRMVTMVFSGASELNKRSLALRHCCKSCERLAVLNGAPRVTNCPSAACASARSMLSPPSIRWLPTPIRVSCTWPFTNATLIKVRSVVPPPTSQTRIRRVSANSVARSCSWRANQS